MVAALEKHTGKIGRPEVQMATKGQSCDSSVCLMAVASCTHDVCKGAIRGRGKVLAALFHIHFQVPIGVYVPA